MKIIILVRHSEPEKINNIPNKEIPLTKNGINLAKHLFENKLFNGSNYVYSSPYKRAFETAKLYGKDVVIDNRLIERVLGVKELLTSDFWERQYMDFNYKNKDGESLNEVNKRMTFCINDILFQMKNNEKVIVVSHATAICAYLLNFCKISVIDAKEKNRKIIFDNKTILNDKIKTPSAFYLLFDENKLVDIKYFE